MLRIHFTAEDLARTTLAAEPDPLWELLLSLHMLQVNDGPVPFGTWRQRIRRRLPRDLVAPLAALAPPVGYSPDFLTPSEEPIGTGDFGTSLNLMLSTPRKRIQHDLSKLAARPAAAGWVRHLAEGGAEPLNRLGHVARAYHQGALAPYWASLSAAVRADHRERATQLATGGVGSVLAGIHPRARWRDQVLEIEPFADQDLHLDGRGLRLQPSYFCWRQPTKLENHDLSPVLVFPITTAGGLVRGDQVIEDTQQRLGALLGRTRAAVLALTVKGCTTTELANACDITLATASHQTAVLRGAGLIESQRQGKSVLHLATPLGLALLEGRGPSASESGSPELPDHGP
ncbi:DNA-binding transcriptional ArsR family regulator [Kribbella amoyensis]|uniref:DNA-binding transcriptional ArsR family regulator n=1 Tax=Kribbella amoyensis TaxID=996641 RepID=A0A561B7P5_9ACTN|nr:winged helix-turn-helix domain-containing protein [Kribbella amoyensis]TWD74722.1 DNA-binding transcriptional ArsR family regulator [Kribbella amoyensis]